MKYKNWDRKKNFQKKIPYLEKKHQNGPLLMAPIYTT